MRNSFKSLVAVAAVLTAASAVHAGIFHYPNLTSGGLSVTNITETNDTASDMYYGGGTLNGTVLSFPIVGGTLPFKAAAIGTTDADFLDVKLSFDVSSSSPLAIAAFLDEVGDYQTIGTGSAGDGASILIFGGNDTLLASGTSSFTTVPNTISHWETATVASGAGSATTFHVVIDNILHATTIAPSDFALIEKKGLSINLGSTSGGGPGTPEPASLGLLGLGGMALLGRRRKA